MDPMGYRLILSPLFFKGWETPNDDAPQQPQHSGLLGSGRGRGREPWKSWPLSEFPKVPWHPATPAAKEKSLVEKKYRGYLFPGVISGQQKKHTS